MNTITMNFIGTGFETTTLTSVYWYEDSNKKYYIALDANGNLIDSSIDHPATCRAFFAPAV